MKRHSTGRSWALGTVLVCVLLAGVMFALALSGCKSGGPTPTTTQTRKPGLVVVTASPLPATSVPATSVPPAATPEVTQAGATPTPYPTSSGFTPVPPPTPVPPLTPGAYPKPPTTPTIGPYPSPAS